MDYNYNYNKTFLLNFFRTHNSSLEGATELKFAEVLDYPGLSPSSSKVDFRMLYTAMYIACTVYQCYNILFVVVRGNSTFIGRG